jgi:septal ring factor EnvC (AmiA/AmiB activator)
MKESDFLNNCVRRSGLLRFAALFGCLAFFLVNAPASASNTLDKLAEIQDKLQSKLQKVKEDRQKENKLLGTLDEIKNNIGQKENEIKKYNSNMSATEKEIQSLSQEIDQLTRNMEGSKNVLTEYVKALHRQQFDSNLLILVSASDYQDFIKKSKYISLVAHHNNSVMKSYREELEQINARKTRLQDLHASLETNIEKAARKKQRLLAEQKKKDELFAEVRNRRIEHEKKLKELEGSSKKLQAMVTELHGKKIPDAILGEGFESLKGNLQWPVNGEVLIPYGKHEDEFKKVVFKNGLEIEVKPGDHPKAIAGGRVVFADKFQGYGNLLIIDHGSGYHSVYGNLEEMTIRESELLVEGMDVGKVSKSDTTNQPALYFELRHKGKPIDPMNWLQRKS